MTDLVETVHSTVLEVVARKQPQLTAVANADRLSDLGLGSLDLAEVIVKLEAALDVDPFAELVSVTSLRTVGDLLRAYADAAEDAARCGS
jgi:acyl carrier protein